MSVDTRALNERITILIDKKNRLNSLGYDNPSYDQLEEEIHDLEDELMDKYGNYLEDALHEVHDEYCPDSEVLLPIAYLPNIANKTAEGYKVDFRQGAYVEVDDYPGTETKLVILPSPTRIILQINAAEQLVVWASEYQE